MEDELNTPPLDTELQSGLIEADQAYSEKTDSLMQQLQATNQYINSQTQIEAEQDASIAAALAKDEEPTFISETGAALGGGAIGAVESVGGFAELTGDTLKTGFNTLFGRPVDDTQNPFSDDYIAGDGSWLDVPDEWTPENKTGLGKLARGFVEFGLLTAATGGVGGAVGGGLRVGARGLAFARSFGVGERGIRALTFVGKGAKVLGDGAAAELISDSAEDENLMNMVNEHTPWMSSWLSNALATTDEDDPWTARIKTVLVGAGMNGVAYPIVAFIKGRRAGIKAKAKGATVEESNKIANDTYDKELSKGDVESRGAAQERANDNYAQGMGIRIEDPRREFVQKYLDKDEYAAYLKQQEDNTQQVLEQVDEQIKVAKKDGNAKLLKSLNKTKKDLKATADSTDYETLADQRGAGSNDVFDFETNQSTKQALENAGREADPFNNPDQFNASEKSTYGVPDDALKTNLRESVTDMKRGGRGSSSTTLMPEATIRQIARGDKNLMEYIEEATSDLAEMAQRKAFTLPDDTQNFDDIKRLLIQQTADMTAVFERGGEIDAITKKFTEYLKGSGQYKSHNFKKNGKDIEIITGDPLQKAALQITINTLAKKAQNIATGAVHGGGSYQQASQVFDAMQVAIIEHKKIGYMWGLDGRFQQIAAPVEYTESTLKQIKNMEDEVVKMTDHLRKMAKDGDTQGVKDLMEIHALMPDVTTAEMMYDFLKAKVFGGNIRGVKIRGEIRKQIQGVFYNSILSAPITSIKAIGGTNLIAFMRPLQAYMGAKIMGNPQDAVIAASMLDAYGKAIGESFKMFQHNWDQGLNRRTMSYDTKYDLGSDLAEWQSLKPKIERYGSFKDKMAYAITDRLVNFNTHPFMKYSQNAMGAGDAFARTIVGRMEMRAAATREVLAEGADLKDAVKLAAKIEEKFRNKIFSKNREGRYVVSDAAAKMAGDEAAMTRPLQGNLAALEQLADLPFAKAFFPFVRTGFNALELSFEHTPLQMLLQKHKDIMKSTDPVVLAKYGLTKETVGQAQALLQGRMYMGSTIIAGATLAALAGNMTGDPPIDKETRKNMQQQKIPFNSFKVPGTSTYVSYKNIEPFNTLFAMTANVVNNAHLFGEDLTDDLLKKIVFMTGSVLVDKSMLSGVEDLARVLNPETAGSELERTGSRFIRSHLPMSGMLRSVGDVLDGVQREAQTLGEMIIKKDALMKSGLPAQYDILSKDRTGKKLTYGPENPLLRLLGTLNPIPITIAEGDDEVKSLLLEMRYNMPDELSTHNDVPLSSEEMSGMQRHLSTGKLRQRLEDLFKSRRWRNAFETYKKEKGAARLEGRDQVGQGWYLEIQRIFRQEKKVALDKFYKEFPDFAERADTEKTIQTLEKSNSTERIIEQLMKLPR